MDLIEKMARAACIAKGRDPDSPRWVDAHGDGWGLAWHEHIDASRIAAETILSELPEKSTGIGQRSPDYVRGFNEARNVIVNALAKKE